jgi:hypothetical protein
MSLYIIIIDQDGFTRLLNVFTLVQNDIKCRPDSLAAIEIFL